MKLDCTCCDISKQKFDLLMKGSRPISGAWLRRKICKHLPWLYDELALDFPNPYESQCRATKTHYIYVHSMIEYFITKD